MPFKWDKFVLSLCLLTFLGACTPPSGSSSKTSPPATPGVPGTPAGPPPAQGTVDSGGGNTYLGKPLESYLRKSTDLPSYQEFIRPILEELQKNAPSIYPVFMTILNKKTWYFVPGELKTLPQEKIGSAVMTDQGALQDFKQVWINSDIFDKMAGQDQARLILHEILMGFRLLRFDSSKNECLAFEAQYNECMRNSEKVRGKPSDLTDKDYADIRAAVTDIQANYKGMGFSDWDDLLWRYGFSSADRVFIGKKTRTKISVSKLQEMVAGAKILGDGPKYGFEIEKLAKAHPEIVEANLNPPTPFTWNSEDSCRFDLSVHDDQYQFELMASAGKVHQTYYFSESEFEMQDIQGLGGQWVSRIRIFPANTGKNKFEMGSSRFDVSLDFVGKRLYSVYIYEATCLNADCSSYSGKDNGINYTCSSEKSLTLGKK